MADPLEDFYIGDIKIVPSRNLVVSESDDRYSLEPRIMDVLCKLAATPREVVSRELLISEIWQVQFGGDESLTRAISIIRKTLKKAGISSKIIETIPKRGYRLAKDISFNPVNSSPKFSNTDEHEIITSNESIHDEVKASTADDLSSFDNTTKLTQQSEPSYPERPKSVLSPRLLRTTLPAIIVALAIGGGWWLGRNANNSEAENPLTNKENQLIEFNNFVQQPNQAELATAILFSHLDGQMSKQAAIKGAEPHLELAKETMPDNPATLIAIGWMYFLTDESEQAQIQFERAKVANAQLESAWVGLAYLATDNGNLDLALFNLTQAISINSFSFRARGKKAELYLMLGDLKNAHSELETILAYSPENYFANMLLEKIKLFEVYDRNKDLLLMPGEISPEDSALHQLLEVDGKAGLTIHEFKSRGKMEWFAQSKSDAPASFGNIPLINVNFDLRNTDDPTIDINR